MATIVPNMNFRVGTGPKEDDQSLILASWANLNGANNVGTPVLFAQWADRSVQLTGCFNTGTVVIEGSNDGTNYSNLSDMNGNAVAFTAAGLRQIVEAPLYARPRVVANGAATDVGVTLLLRRNSPLTR
jgi:hypothetical protein